MQKKVLVLGFLFISFIFFFAHEIPVYSLFDSGWQIKINGIKNDDSNQTSGINSLQFARTYGGSLYEYANRGQQTSDGGYVLLGRTESFASSVDIWVLKIIFTLILLLQVYFLKLLILQSSQILLKKLSERE